MSTDTLQISNDSLALTVSLAGGAIRQFDRRTTNGTIPVFSRGKATGDLCFPMIPFGNRLGGNAFAFEGETYRLKRNTDVDPLYIHGDAWVGRWQTVVQGNDELILAYEHADAESPYAYRAEQRFTLVEATLAVSLSVTNLASRRLPYGLGLHPFLPMTAATTLDFSAIRYWEQDESFLPSRSLPAMGGMDFSGGRTLPGTWMNTEFEGWNGAATITWPETDSSLLIEADPQFSRCMIFVSDPAFDASYQREHFCFEPMTHSVDAHHRPGLGGLIPLAPGETLQASCSFTTRQWRV